MRTILIASILLGACASKSAAAPSSPEPAAPAEPATPTDAAEQPEPAEKQPEPALGDVLAVVTAQGSAKIFTELLGLSDAAKGLHSMDGSGYTLLVPTDAAFAKLPKGTLERLKKHTAELDRVIKYHMVLGTNDVNKLTNFRTAPTAEGHDLEVKVSQDTDVLIQGAKLVETDLKASNGYVHLIDKVLLPKK